MDHTVILQYIQTLGFPICVSISLAWALYKIGGKLLESFFRHIDEINPKLDRIVEAVESTNNHVSKWPSDLVKTVSDSVKEEIAKQLERSGCKLTQSEINALFKTMEQK